MTQTDGSYAIPYLCRETYYMDEVETSGWTRTYPSILPEIVALDVGQAVENKNFGSVETGNWPGALDAAFGTDGIVVGRRGRDWAAAIQSDGRIVTAGTGDSQFVVVRYNRDGSLDTSFGDNGEITTTFGSGWPTVGDIALQADGKIVVAGYISNDGARDCALVRYNTDGSLDASFGLGGKVTTPIGQSGVALDVAIQSDGRIVVAGASVVEYDHDFAVLRYNPDGSLDASFGDNGVVTTPIASQENEGGSDLAYSLAIQSDGKIVVAGVSEIHDESYDVALVRYNLDGSLDSSFGAGGITMTDLGYYDDNCGGVAVQSDGKIVLAGGNRFGFVVARYNANGFLDASFGDNGKVTTQIGAPSNRGSATDIAIQSDGRIVLAGNIRQPFQPYNYDDVSTDFALACYNADGSLDTSFGVGGKMTTSVGRYDWSSSIAVQADGKIVLAGESDGHLALARYLALAEQAEVTTLGKGQSIADGDTAPDAADGTDFGSVVQGQAAISRNFTVRNDGAAALTLGPVTVPAGFTLTEDLSASLAPGASDTFTVRLDTSAPGVMSGDISFATSDSDENPFNFRITGTVAAAGVNKTIGNTTVFSNISEVTNRRAMPFATTEAGAIQSISIYHQGGTGHAILAVYADVSGRPGARLGVTAPTVINGSEGWQTIALQSPVSVSSGQTVWLAWVFENDPGMRWTEGRPGRAISPAAWSGGMPSSFGSSSATNGIYSIYANYTSTSGAAASGSTVSPESVICLRSGTRRVSAAPGRRASRPTPRGRRACPTRSRGWRAAGLPGRAGPS